MAETSQKMMLLAADGTPLKLSLSRSLRQQKLRALLLISPLLIFVTLTFVLPIGNMLFRSVQNDIVSNIMPHTVIALEDWQPERGQLPEETVYKAAFYDLFSAAKAKEHTKLGARLNYEQTGIASTFRKSGRAVAKPGKTLATEFIKIDPAWKRAETFSRLFTSIGQEPGSILVQSQLARLNQLKGEAYQTPGDFKIADAAARALPLTAREFAYWALFTELDKGKSISSGKVWEALYVALADDLQNPQNTDAINALSGPVSTLVKDTATLWQEQPEIDYAAIMDAVNKNWSEPVIWETIKLHSPVYTSGYFLNAVDMRKTLDGPAAQPESKQILLNLFQRTVKMSLIITISCILLGYPVAWLLANLPIRASNILMILVLLPFWTSLLVRTSAWKVMLQQQGVINEVLVWLGLVATDNRLEIINNQFGTIVAMTHILLPFMILPMYSVMQTIPPSYVRAAKSLGATNWTAFWRVYFPQSVPGIGAGSILVFILAIGYYITPEIVGGTDGVFISNRIAYHISRSLNWGLAAALGGILLAVVLVLYWAYDKIVGIDNVKLG
ncbi:MAG: ABC transporter permease [Candidatus Puniceispirillaceae bacterium]